MTTVFAALCKTPKMATRHALGLAHRAPPTTAPVSRFYLDNEYRPDVNVQAMLSKPAKADSIHQLFSFTFPGSPLEGIYTYSPGLGM